MDEPEVFSLPFMSGKLLLRTGLPVKDVLFVSVVQPFHFLHGHHNVSAECQVVPQSSDTVHLQITVFSQFTAVFMTFVLWESGGCMSGNKTISQW